MALKNLIYFTYNTEILYSMAVSVTKDNYASYKTIIMQSVEWEGDILNELKIH